MSGNTALLQEATLSGAWFHARKVRAIRARKLEQDAMLETREGPVAAKAGDYLCRGAAGEHWPQTAESLHNRYVETDEIDAAGWKVFAPRLDAEGVFAARIAHPFIVESAWGRMQGKAGDYLCKNFADRGDADPADVWIVDALLFEATYAAVTS